MGDKHSVSAETGSSSPPLSLSSVNVRRSVSPPTNISLEACGAIYDERVNGNVSPSQVRKLGSQVSPKDQRTMSPTQDHGKLSPVSLRDDVKLSPTSSTQSVPCQGGSSAIGVSRKFPHGGCRCTAGACLARAALTSDPSQSCQHTTVCDMAVPVNGDTQKDSAASHSNNSQATKSPVSSPKVLSPVVHIRNGDASHLAESHLNLCDAVTNNNERHKSPTSDSSTQAGATKPTSPSDAANLAGRGCVDVATPFHALPPPYRVTRTGSSPIAPHRGQSSPSDVTQQKNAKKMEPGNDMTNGLPACPLTTAGTSFVLTAQCQPTSPGSSVAGSVASFSFDGGLAAPGIRQKQTLGELLQQVDVVSRALRSKGDFTCPDFLPDLQFLAHQSRYNSDAGIKRRIISRLVDAGILEISIKVFWFLSSVDYLGTVAMATTMTADHNDNVACMDESTESIPMLLVHGRLDHRRALMKSQGKVDSIESEGQSQVSMTDVVKIVHAVITCLQCTTERSAILCEGCVRRGLMQMMLLELADPRLTCTDPKDQCKVYVVKGFLSVLCNIIRNYGDGRFAFRLAGALRVLQLHLKSPLLPVKIKTVILLSYVVTETENEIVNATDKHIGLVVKMLQTTVDSNNHYSRKYGFSATEAVAGLNRLGCYELNKERMAKCGAVSLYSRLLQREVSHEEQLLAVRGVWTLAFHQGNRRQLQQDDACLQALQYLEKEGTREEIRSSAKGALWVICGRNMFMKDVIPVSSVTAGDYHVMVSYQWSSRVYVARLCDRLQAAGCKVWLDLEHKGGAPVEIMKEAVEKASMVLMCMSQKYKDSPSCRTEAEYVEHSRRPLIPVCIQPHFTPDGWLTTLLSDKFVYNFSHESYITLMLENLLKDISCCGGARAKKTRSQTENLSVPATVANIPSSPPLHDSSKVRLRSEVSRWTTKEVMDWLTSNDLHPVAESFEHVNGELLEQVRRLQVAAPDTFYAVLKRDLSLGFIDILKFTAALEKLPWSSSIS